MLRRKCSGHLPCELCARRGRAEDCKYEPGPCSISAVQKAALNDPAAKEAANQRARRTRERLLETHNKSTTEAESLTATSTAHGTRIRLSLRQREEGEQYSTSSSVSIMEEEDSCRQEDFPQSDEQGEAHVSDNESDCSGFEFEDEPSTQHANVSMSNSFPERLSYPSFAPPALPPIRSGHVKTHRHSVSGAIHPFYSVPPTYSHPYASPPRAGHPYHTLPRLHAAEHSRSVKRLWEPKSGDMAAQTRSPHIAARSWTAPTTSGQWSQQRSQPYPSDHGVMTAGSELVYGSERVWHPRSEATQATRATLVASPIYVDRTQTWPHHSSEHVRRREAFSPSDGYGWENSATADRGMCIKHSRKDMQIDVGAGHASYREPMGSRTSRVVEEQAIPRSSWALQAESQTADARALPPESSSSCPTRV